MEVWHPGWLTTGWSYTKGKFPMWKQLISGLIHTVPEHSGSPTTPGTQSTGILVFVVFIPQHLALLLDISFRERNVWECAFDKLLASWLWNSNRLAQLLTLCLKSLHWHKGGRHSCFVYLNWKLVFKIPGETRSWGTWYRYPLKVPVLKGGPN